MNHFREIKGGRKMAFPEEFADAQFGGGEPGYSGSGQYATDYGYSREKKSEVSKGTSPMDYSDDYDESRAGSKKEAYSGSRAARSKSRSRSRSRSKSRSRSRSPSRRLTAQELSARRSQTGKSVSHSLGRDAYGRFLPRR